jgi:tRNA(Ile)-lysidine synthase
LIPFLEEYNPQIRQVLWRTTNILQEDLVVLERMIQRSWQECLLELGEGYVSFDYNNFREQSLGIQRHVFRRAIAMLQPGLRDIDYETIERAVSFLVAPARSARCDLKSGLRLLFEDDCLWIVTWETDLPSNKWPQLKEPTTADIEVPGKIILGEGWELHTELVPEVDRVREQAFTNTNPFQAWLDASKLQYPLSVRVRQSGDRFKPLGMKGRSMKLAEFMVNVKIPRRARAGWPLICSGDEVLWIPGFRIGHPSRVTVQTKEIIQLSLVKKKLN